MHLGSTVVADEESAALVQPGEGALDHPAFAPEPRAVLGLAARDHRLDATRPELAAMALGVIAAVGNESLRTPPRPADTAAHCRDGVDEREQLGDVVAVAASEPPGQWQPGAVGQEMVLGARTAPVDRARTRFGAPFFAWI